MLVVSDLIAVARGLVPASQLRRQSPQRFGEERAPVIVWNVCRHCNMTCPHCYAAASVKPSAHDLDHAAAMRMIDDLADSGVRIIIFSGGEPLLRDDLLELVRYATSRQISCQLSTNGALFDVPMASAAADAGIRYVGVSVDGLPEFNDAYRGLERGYELAIAGLVNARAAGMRTGLRITATRRNVDQVFPLLNKSRELGLDRFYLSHLVYAGRALKMVGDDVEPASCRATLLALFDDVDNWLAQHGDQAATKIVTGGNDSDGPLLLSWAASKHGEAAAHAVEELLTQRGGNSAGEGMLNIDHRGDVHPDQFWRAATLGNLRTQRFAEVLAHPLRQQLATRVQRLEGRCGRCRFKPMCRGSHRERALASNGSLWGPDPACVMRDDEIHDDAHEARVTP